MLTAAVIFGAIGFILFNIFFIWMMYNTRRCDHHFEYEEFSDPDKFPVKICKKCGQRITTKFGD